MARDEMLRVFCYDVTSDSRRRKIAHVLEDSASRVQFSVFEARLTAAAVRRVVSKVERHLAQGDSLRVYTVGIVGERHCDVYGSGVPIEAEGSFWLL